MPLGSAFAGIGQELVAVQSKPDAYPSGYADYLSQIQSGIGTSAPFKAAQQTLDQFNPMPAISAVGSAAGVVKTAATIFTNPGRWITIIMGMLLVMGGLYLLAQRSTVLQIVSKMKG